MTLADRLKALLNQEDLNAYLAQHPRLFAALLDAEGSEEAKSHKFWLSRVHLQERWLQQCIDNAGGFEAFTVWAHTAVKADFIPYTMEPGDALPPLDHGLIFKITDPEFAYPGHVQVTQIVTEALGLSWFVALRFRMMGSLDPTIMDGGGLQTAREAIRAIGKQIGRIIFNEEHEGRIYMEVPRVVVGGEAPNIGPNPEHVETPVCWWFARAVT
ncbi:MAG: hypothetical protein WC911_01785 [Thermoleophilia bacterium]